MGHHCITRPIANKRKQGFEKTKLDLEKELRETDERLWKDTAEIREKLIAAARRFDGTYLRSNLSIRLRFTMTSTKDKDTQAFQTKM